MKFNYVNVNSIVIIVFILISISFAPFDKSYIVHRVLQTLNRGHFHQHKTQLDFDLFNYSFLWSPTSFLPFHLLYPLIHPY